MRLKGQAKAGFYPTPLVVARLIGSCLVMAGDPHLLDPCCATGAALKKVRFAMRGCLRNTTHGVAEDISIFRFPNEHYDAFKQVIVFGVKRAAPSYPSLSPKVVGDLSIACTCYVVPEAKSTPQLYLTGQDPEVLVAEARTRGRWRRAWDLPTPPDLQAFRPPLPLRKGHVALLMASGLLNNTLVEADGRRSLVRGRVYKEVVSYDEKDDKGIKHVERDVIKTEVTALDIRHGRSQLGPSLLTHLEVHAAGPTSTAALAMDFVRVYHPHGEDDDSEVMQMARYDLAHERRCEPELIPEADVVAAAQNYGLTRAMVMNVYWCSIRKMAPYRSRGADSFVSKMV